MGGKRGTPDERFKAKVVVTDGCYGWNSARSPNGYGMFSITGTKTTQAHRFAWEQAHGPIPDGIQVGHRCHDEDESCVGKGAECPHRACTRLDHLYLQTPKENSQAGHGNPPDWVDPRTLRTHCKRGHEFTPANIKWYRGRRACRTCINIHQLRRYHDRKRE